MTTLLDKLGGTAPLGAVVDKFYDIMLADPVVSQFFKNTDMTHQRSQQKAFLGMVRKSLFRSLEEMLSIKEKT